jgi:hypothetical protein
MTGYTIDIAPFVPLWSLIIAAVVLTVVFVWLVWRRIPGSVFRGALAALLLLALANPALLEERRERNPDVALLIVDETPSQETVGRIAETRRVAEEISAALDRHRAEGLEVRRLTLRHESLRDGADGTRVVERALEALADVPDRRYAGTILVSDGQIHDADALADLPDGPLHALIVGERGAPDRRLAVIEAPSFGVVGEPVEVVIRIEDPTAGADDLIRPTVILDGQPQRTARIPFNEDVRISLSIDHRGPSVVELSVPPLPGELSEINNESVLTINGVRDRLRVLLVSGEPHPGERTWRNLLKADPSVDLVHFTILRPPEKQDGTPIDELSLIAFPTRELFEVRLHDFDLIVFDSYRRRGVLPSIYLGNIVDYVRDGGALLDAAGPGFAGPFSLYRTALGDILPLEPLGGMIERPFVPMVTDRGLRHPVTAGLPGGPDRLPGADGPAWGEWLRQLDVARRAGDVILEGIDGMPLVTLDRVGEGRVAQMSSDHIWLWARGYDGGGPQAELLRRLAHWLMKEPELEEEDLRAVATDDGLEIELRTLDDRERAEVRITGPDGAQTDLPLERLANGIFAGETPLTQSGIFEVTDGARTARVAAGVLNALEFSRLTATAEYLDPAVDASGGRLRWAATDGTPDIRMVAPDRPAGGSGWIGLVANGDYTVVGLDAVPMIPGWLLFLAAIGLLGASWYREAR